MSEKCYDKTSIDKKDSKCSGCNCERKIVLDKFARAMEKFDGSFEEISGLTDSHLLRLLEQICKTSNPNYEIVINELLKRGWKINDMQNSNISMLMIAAELGHLGVVEYLIRFGADVRAKIFHDRDALVASISKGHVKVACKLIDFGSEIERDANNPLSFAARVNSLEVAEKLVNNGADVNKFDQRLASYPILLAITAGHFEMLAFLLSKGAKVDVQDSEDAGPLHLAVKSGNLEIIEKLIQMGAKICCYDKLKRNLLHYACLQDKVEILKRVQELESFDVNGVDEKGLAPLHLASAQGHLNIVKELLNCGAEVKVKNLECLTPLALACSKGHIDIVEILVEAGSDLESEDLLGNTPLQLACLKGNFELMKYLVSKGSNVNTTNKEQSFAHSESLGIFRYYRVFD